MKNPRLEKASWIAAIIGTIWAIIVFFFPTSPSSPPLLSYANERSMQMDTETRRDFIAACMFSGGFAVKGKEPAISQNNGTIDIERTVNSWVNLFDNPADKLKAGREIRKCLQEILRADTYQPPTSSRIVSRDNLYAELALSIDPVEYAKGIVCKRPDIRQQLTLSYQLRQLGKNVDPRLKNKIDAFFSDAFGLNQAGSIETAIRNLNPNDIDCSVERICEVRGSVPVKVNTDTMHVFEIPMRQVRVLAGQCQNKVGFVNERFIDF